MSEHQRGGPAGEPPVPAREAGRISAVAGRSQRDLQDCAARYPELFAGRPFDPALYSTIALANAFCAPWLDADRLRAANRATLWAFGLDWLVDYVATDRSQVTEIVDGCVAVAGGAEPATLRPDGDRATRQLLEFLAEIRAELVAAPGFGPLGALWRAEVARTVTAMLREWEWQAARVAGTGPLPDFAEYLANSDNLCFCFVFTTHWVFTAGPGDPPRRAAELIGAARVVQQVIRLLNDLGTYERDVTWGDLNPLMLGVDREDVTRQIGALIDRCRELLPPLADAHPELSRFLDRYIWFNVGFYGGADYWGSL